MPVALIIFNSPSEFRRYVEKTIAEASSELGEHMKAIEEVRKRHERAKKRDEMIRKLVGKPEAVKDTKQLDVGGFKILVSPTAEYELTLMEAAITSLQEKVSLFEKAKEMFPAITDESMRIGAVLTNGLPTGFILFTQD